MAQPPKAERKFADITPFKGDASDRHRARTFFSECRMQLAGNQHIYDTDTLKVFFVYTQMKEGPANTWAFNRRNLAETLNPANPDYGTFDQLEKDFYQVFVSPDFDAETRRNLLSIRQGQDEPIATFVDRFKTLAVQAGITEYSTLSETFKRGIHGPLIDHINSRAEIPTQMETTTANNVTTTGWYKAAIQAETALKRTRGLNQTVQSRYNNFRNNFRPAIPPHFARGPPPRPFAPQYRPFVPNRPSPLNPNQPPRNPGFAPNFRSNNLSQICFRCNRPGHIAKYCSLPPPAQSNTVGIRQMETPMEDFTNYYAYYPEPQQTQEQSYHYTPEVYYETPAPASAEETQPPPLQPEENPVPQNSANEFDDSHLRGNVSYIRTLMENISTEEFTQLLDDLERDFL